MSHIKIQIRICPKDLNKTFTEKLGKLHYLGNCPPTGRYIRFIAVFKGNIIGGFILRSTIPHITCRDKFFGLYNYRIKGRIPDSKSKYWQILNKIPNMARAYIDEPFQNRGFGIRMIREIEKQAISLWKKKYNDDVIGIECQDIAPPEKAKLFTLNGWKYIGKTKGYSKKKRVPFGGPNRDCDNPIIGKLEIINPQWYVYAKKL